MFLFGGGVSGGNGTAGARGGGFKCRLRGLVKFGVMRDSRLRNDSLRVCGLGVQRWIFNRNRIGAVRGRYVVDLSRGRGLGRLGSE